MRTFPHPQLRLPMSWNFEELLEEYDEVIHIPMSSGLSSSCETAIMLAKEFDGRVHVVDNQRISVTQRQSVMDAIAMRDKGCPQMRSWMS